MLLEAWNVYGGGRQSEYGEGGEEEISPSPVQYKIGAFQKVGGYWEVDIGRWILGGGYWEVICRVG